MGTETLLMDLFCVFAPLCGLELFQYRRSRARPSTETRPWILAAILTASAVASALFNFGISNGVKVNLCIVPLSLSFALLTWLPGVAVVTVYVLAQVGESWARLAQTVPWASAARELATRLPAALVMVAGFTAMMLVCQRLARGRSVSVQSAWFVTGLAVYAGLDYVYIYRFSAMHPLLQVGFVSFASYVLLFTLSFLAAFRFVVAGQNVRARACDELRSQKLELLSQLSSSVAHEIRNPITVVRGFAQLMLDTEYDRARTVQFLNLMLAELNRAEGIIGNYLQLSKRSIDGTSTEVNLSQALEYVVDILTPYAASRNVQLNRHIAQDLVVFGSPSYLNQALVNLVKNAIESHERPGRVDVRAQSCDRWVVLTISDRGRGISRAELSRLGEPYYWTKSQGTGLGLTLAYKVVYDMGGKIEVQSREGVGTTFTLRMPEMRHFKVEGARALPARQEPERQAGTPAARELAENVDSRGVPGPYAPTATSEGYAPDPEPLLHDAVR